MPNKFNELLLKQDIIELYNTGITPDYGYLMNGRFEKDMIKTLYPLKALSGNPISWEASDTEYLFPIISLEPKQAGSGDPNPENVRPISGWDEVTVNVRGAQLCDVSQMVIGGINGSTGENFTAENRIRVPFIYVVAGQTYTISGYSGLNIANAHYYDENQNWIKYVNLSDTFTVQDGASYIRFTFSKPDQSNFTDSELEQLKQTLMFNFGSTPTPYEPYQPGTTATLTLPETIYGGTVDAVTGVGEVTRKVTVLDGEINKLRVSGSGFWITPNNSAPGIANNKAELICTIAPPTAMIVNPIYQFIGFSSTWTTQYFADVDEFNSFCKNQASAGTPVQVAYKLATPEPCQATGNQQLTSLIGYNTIYTDGDSMVLNRKARRLEV